MMPYLRLMEEGHGPLIRPRSWRDLGELAAEVLGRNYQWRRRMMSAGLEELTRLVLGKEIEILERLR
ncbi:hypothetical protein Sjap_009392 [Stephania japonica]|uniref:Uncharacterized protein n=1 Tax=Stephania japonica TaxID=461633 RepID=A0AAP0JST7_9MAGN